MPVTYTKYNMSGGIAEWLALHDEHNAQWSGLLPCREKFRIEFVNIYHF